MLVARMLDIHLEDPSWKLFVDSMLEMADFSCEASAWRNTNTWRFKVKGSIILWIRFMTSKEMNPKLNKTFVKNYVIAFRVELYTEVEETFTEKTVSHISYTSTNCYVNLMSSLINVIKIKKLKESLIRIRYFLKLCSFANIKVDQMRWERTWNLNC